MEEGTPLDPFQYPFDVPVHSFLWRAAGFEVLSDPEHIDELTAERHAVLAIGSNASPQQLTRKFDERRFSDPTSPEGQIPVLRAEVGGVDVVYGAHLAGYGALPATLLDVSGACAQVFVTWLSSMQFERMNESEGLGRAYQLRQVAGVRMQGRPVMPAVSYVTTAGVALFDGSPLGLASTSTSGSPWPRATQREAWNLLSIDMGFDGHGEALLKRVLDSPDWRRKVKARLGSSRLPVPHAPVAI